MAPVAIAYLLWKQYLAVILKLTITMTPQWARWRLKSPASRLFTPIVYSAADQRKHQSSASLAFVWGIHRRPVNSPHKWPVTRKMFPFDDVIMASLMVHISKQSKFSGNWHTCSRHTLLALYRYTEIQCDISHRPITPFLPYKKTGSLSYVSFNDEDIT